MKRTIITLAIVLLPLCGMAMDLVPAP